MIVPIYTVVHFNSIYKLERYNSLERIREILPDVYQTEEEAKAEAKKLNLEAYNGVPAEDVETFDPNIVNCQFAFYILDESGEQIIQSCAAPFKTRYEAENKDDFLTKLKNSGLHLSDGQYLVYVDALLNGYDYSTVQDLNEDKIYITNQLIEVNNGEISLK